MNTFDAGRDGQSIPRTAMTIPFPAPLDLSSVRADRFVSSIGEWTPQYLSSVQRPAPMSTQTGYYPSELAFGEGNDATQHQAQSASYQGYSHHGGGLGEQYLGADLAPAGGHYQNHNNDDAGDDGVKKHKGKKKKHTSSWPSHET